MAMNQQQKRILIGVAVVGGVALLPVMAPLLRNAARSALKAGVLVYEKGREYKARLDEVVEDVVAEVQEELLEAREAKEMAARLGAELDAEMGKTQTATETVGLVQTGSPPRRNPPY